MTVYTVTWVQHRRYDGAIEEYSRDVEATTPGRAIASVKARGREIGRPALYVKVTGQREKHLITSRNAGKSTASTSTNGPKWPKDHEAKHAAAARKGWVTRRSGERKAASEARPLKPRAGTAGARFNPHDTTGAQATRQLVNLYGVRQLPTALNGYSREHLADVARNLGIPHTGTKPELVSRITRHMASERTGAKSAPVKPRTKAAPHANEKMTYEQYKSVRAEHDAVLRANQGSGARETAARRGVYEARILLDRANPRHATRAARGK